VSASVDPPVGTLRLVASVIACTVGLAFWWALTEPLPVPPVVLFSLPIAILLASGVIAGRFGAVAAPCALLFSVLLGSLIATQLHHAFTPASLPVSRFGGFAIEPVSLAVPLLVAAGIGAVGGVIGERILPSRR
jgi:hypothetical protein